MITLKDLDLYVLDTRELEMHVVPTFEDLYNPPIQEILRDVASICDWCVEHYPEVAGYEDEDENWRYVARELQPALIGRVHRWTKYNGYKCHVM